MLVLNGSTRFIDPQTWDYPSTSECMQCHTSVASCVLGPETAQMNREYDYPGEGTQNQLDYLNNLGVLIVYQLFEPSCLIKLM